MCGIAGFVHLDGRPAVRGRDDVTLGSMGDAMRHRGPDDTQYMLWQNVAFVFKRLSIVDVGGGRQPIETADGRISAMVNGEMLQTIANSAQRSAHGMPSARSPMPRSFLICTSTAAWTCSSG